MSLPKGIQPLSLIVNKVKEELDIQETDELKLMCERLNKEKASFSAIHCISPSLHEGIGVIYNRKSGTHNNQF